MISYLKHTLFQRIFSFILQFGWQIIQELLITFPPKGGCKADPERVHKSKLFWKRTFDFLVSVANIPLFWNPENALLCVCGGVGAKWILPGGGACCGHRPKLVQTPTTVLQCDPV